MFSPSLLKLLRGVQRALIATAFVTATLSLGAWIFRVDAFVNLHSYYGTMKFNVALAFTLLSIGVSLFFRYPKISKLVTIFVIVLGLITVSQDLLGWHFGIDEFFAVDTEAPQHLAPGRMSPITAGLLCFLGVVNRSFIPVSDAQGSSPV